MTLDHSPDSLSGLLKELTRLPHETEWVEFKHNNDDPSMIGEYISALANSAALLGKQSAWLVWGIHNEDHSIVGTQFNPAAARHKQQELESWLLQKTVPKIHFKFYRFEVDGVSVVILEIPAASHTPVQFDGVEYIRIGSYKKRLKEHPEKERELWRVFDRVPFEHQMAAENITAEQVFRLIDYPSYFDMTDAPLPENREAILAALEADRMIQRSEGGRWHIRNLGAILFAKKLQDFRHLGRKAVRLIQYRGSSRVESVRELEGSKGYAVGFEGLIDYIKTLLPHNEEIGKALRREVSMYPDLAIRELVANAIIHQDFSITGTGPMVEIFDTRMEITNPGLPLVATERFLDSPPRSRNEALASFLRRVGICEERGSGIEKVVVQTELYQLPAPLFETADVHTRALLFAYRKFKEMDSEERLRACYMHCVLRYVNREVMNNTSLRERFGVDAKNSAMVSRLIKQACENGLIRPYDAEAGSKAMRYVPSWV